MGYPNKSPETGNLFKIVTLSAKTSLILGENKAGFGREGHNYNFIGEHCFRKKMFRIAVASAIVSPWVRKR